MPFQLIDRQGTHAKEDILFETKQDIIDELADYHDQDWTSDEYETIYDLLKTLTPDDQIQFLCEYGDWEVVEVSEVIKSDPIN